MIILRGLDITGFDSLSAAGSVPFRRNDFHQDCRGGRGTDPHGPILA